jgi:hypothetical protein
MLLVFGTRMYGQTYAFAGSAVVTEFFHIWYLPIVPRRSLLIDMSSGRRLPTSMKLRSIAAGYLGIWGALGTILTGFTALRTFGKPLWWAWALASVALAALAIWAWKRAWKLAPDDEARRGVYAKVTGQPFDVSMLPIYDADVLRAELRPKLIERLRALTLGTYRTTQDPDREWDEIVLKAPQVDADILDATVTLAALEARLAEKAERVRYQRAHDRLWSRWREETSRAAR